MAEVVNSLFGITPESLMAEREKALQEQAMQYAKADPFQRATAAIYSGANRLGGAVGGLLGAQDPEMMRIQQRQGVLQNLDLTNPESLKQGIQTAMQNKDYQLVSELTNRYQQRTAAELAARKTEAEITAKTAEKKSFSVGDKAFLALAAKATPASVKAAQDAGNDISLLDVPEAEKVSTYGQVLKDSGLTPGTPEFQKRMQEFAAAELEGTRKGKGTTLTLPGQQVPDKDWLKFREFTDKTPVMQKTSALLSELPNALETIRLSTSNDIAAAALPKALASIAGEGKVTSNADIARYARTGGLDDRLIQSATSFITGKTTTTRKAEAEKYAAAVYRGALLERKKFIQSEAKQLGYDQSPNYKQAVADIDAELSKFKKPSEIKPVDSVVRVQPTGNPLIDKYLNVQTP